ncbi:MAG: PadR family transcriptional regulator [Eubacteriales bacterium]|nr:PadR family transcriptional regulator [Eubacteriales bacterium]
MDIQLKRGFLEACVLAVLTKEDSYGYRLIKDIEPGIEISESTLYPILKRLESGGMLRVYSVEHNGRLRKYYSITGAGRLRLESFLEEWKEVTAVYNFIISRIEEGSQ